MCACTSACLCLCVQNCTINSLVFSLCVGQQWALCQRSHSYFSIKNQASACFFCTITQCATSTSSSALPAAGVTDPEDSRALKHGVYTREFLKGWFSKTICLWQSWLKFCSNVSPYLSSFPKMLKSWKLKWTLLSNLRKYASVISYWE